MTGKVANMATAATYAGPYGLCVYLEPGAVFEGTVTVEQMGNAIRRVDLWQLKKWNLSELSEWAEECTATADEAEALYILLVEVQTGTDG